MSTIPSKRRSRLPTARATTKADEEGEYQGGPAGPPRSNHHEGQADRQHEARDGHERTPPGSPSRNAPNVARVCKPELCQSSHCSTSALSCPLRRWQTSRRHGRRSGTRSSIALPNLIVIGAMKSGTSSLHYYLDAHPDIAMARAKELHFFSLDRIWAKGIDWYAKQFEVPGSGGNPRRAIRSFRTSERCPSGWRRSCPMRS